MSRLPVKAVQRWLFSAFVLSASAGCDTDFATLVGNTFATLNLSFDALDVALGGPDSSWFWQYSTNRSALTPRGQTSCSGTCAEVRTTPRINNALKQEITGLSPNTTYHFQVCARATVGQQDICASIKDFKTGPHARVDPGDTTRFLGEAGSDFRAVGYSLDTNGIPEAEVTFDDLEMPVLKRRLSEIKNLGATAVRVGLPEVTQVMTGVTTFNKARMDAFTNLMEHAESIGLQVVMSGLWDFNTSPANWYEALNESDRWNAQANYWGEFARRLAGNSAVFSYNLINEANVPGIDVSSWKQGPWGYWLTRTAPVPPTTSSDVARNWIRKMTAAIRQFDSLHMITMGGAWPGPIPYTLQAQELSYLSPHVYPAGQVKDNQTAINALRAVKAHGKPVVEDEINGLATFSNQAMEWLLLSAGDTLNGALLTGCHEAACPLPADCAPDDTNFNCQVIRHLWIENARIFQNIVPVLKRTAQSQDWLKHYNGVSGAPPRMFGPFEVPTGYSFISNTAKTRMMADGTAKAILRFSHHHLDGRSRYTTDAAPATFDVHEADGFTFSRVVGFVYPTHVLGTSPIDVYVNAAGNEYLTAAPNDAVLNYLGYFYNRVLGYGWLP